MSDSGDVVKYKWTPESTALLVSVWSDRQVQKQLEYTSKPQLIWESVARYMKKKGYNVSGKQCRSRMKQVLVCYREAKRAGTKAGVEQYYESIDRVLKIKRLEENNVNGIDTVDAAINVKSPPKDIKTSKNLQMRHKFQEPVQSLHRSEALSPTWGLGRENEYPDSPESNETIIAKPYRVFSPTRDVAINTGEQLVQIAGKATQCNPVTIEEPLHVTYKQNLLYAYPYGEIPHQNSVQNVQNQIIQENMQQHQNLQQNYMGNQQNMMMNNLGLQSQYNLNQNSVPQPTNVPMKISPTIVQNSNFEQLLQQQNHLQQVNNRAMPQEPKKVVFGQNLAATYKQQYGNTLTHMPAVIDIKGVGYLSPNYSPDVSQNLNDAFCQSKSDDKAHNLNETYNQAAQVANPLPNQDVSVVTNNATCNDDSILLDFLMDSLSQAGSDNKSRDTAVNTDDIPNVPLRKKKAQKLEQLVLGAISSQNEVVNRILAAQNDMLTKFLDLDKDRHNRLENRLDDLLKIVHNTVLTKQSSETDDIPPPPPEPIITSLVPPPRPGIPPPKLDLVPPKPCRVPCTVPNSNVELINQNPVATRPGIVSPIASPVKKPGTIWSKLGPVSQSPFVKAQQRLGFQPVLTTETRTQSSAERRIAKEMEKFHMDTETLKFETAKFLETEKQLEEKIENARIEKTMSQSLHSRRRLFTQREPTAAMILTAAFLENECRNSEELTNHYENQENLKNVHDDLLAGQGESYEHLRHLNVQSVYTAGEPCDTSTPAKFGTVSGNSEKTSLTLPKQTIQQLAQLVMNTGRWKDLAKQNEQQTRVQPVQVNVERQQNVCPLGYNEAFTTAQTLSRENYTKSEKSHVKDWTLNKYANPTNEQKMTYGSSYNNTNKKANIPMGFTTTMMESEKPKMKEANVEICRSIGFNNNMMPDRKQQTVRFMDEALAELQRMYIERMAIDQQDKNDSLPYVTDSGNGISVQNRQMIEKYINDIMPKRQFKDGKDKDTDSDNDDEFLDTTTSMATILPRRGSLTSTGTTSTETTHSIKFSKDNCVIS